MANAIPPDIRKILRNMKDDQGGEVPQVDDSETIIINATPLIKMLKHGRAGVPIEVMGLMLGEFIDEFTVRVVDVFAMPQSGTSMSVEAIDPVFQTRMLELLSMTERPEMVVGWYHSHPGWGCFLSGVDQATQEAMERLHPRAVAVVVDPIRSVRGRVEIDAFRLFQKRFLLAPMGGPDPRQTTSNICHLKKLDIAQIAHGLNRTYYKMVMGFRMNSLEQKMLLNINQKPWISGFQTGEFERSEKRNLKYLKRFKWLAENYNKIIKAEQKVDLKELSISMVGRVNPKKNLQDGVKKMMDENIDQTLGTMINNIVF